MKLLGPLRALKLPDSFKACIYIYVGMPQQTTNCHQVRAPGQVESVRLLDDASQRTLQAWLVKMKW